LSLIIPAYKQTYVTHLNKKFSCCFDSRSYCVRRTTYVWYIYRPLATIAVVRRSIFSFTYSFQLKSAFDAGSLLLASVISAMQP